MEKYACTPLTMGANPDDSGPVDVGDAAHDDLGGCHARGRLHRQLTGALAFPQAAIPIVSATTAAPTVANLPRRLRDIGPPLPVTVTTKGQAPRVRRGPGSTPCLTSVSVRAFVTVAWAVVRLRYGAGPPRPAPEKPPVGTGRSGQEQPLGVVPAQGEHLLGRHRVEFTHRPRPRRRPTHIRHESPHPLRPPGPARSRRRRPGAPRRCAATRRGRSRRWRPVCRGW